MSTQAMFVQQCPRITLKFYVQKIYVRENVQKIYVQKIYVRENVQKIYVREIYPNFFSHEIRPGTMPEAKLPGKHVHTSYVHETSPRNMSKNTIPGKYVQNK